MAEVALTNIAKVYPNGVTALRDFNLQVADGEFVVLVGPSGCGKTTTLRLIAGLEEPTSGTVRIGGRTVNAVPPRDRDVALVFQRATLYPHLSVRRNLTFGLQMRQRWRWLQARSRRRQGEQVVAERVAQIAHLLGLQGLLERLPGQLSGGEQQRVALGRALVRQPAAFLLDEPLSQLDGRLRSELRHELHLLQRRLRATMVYVTHDQTEAMTLADRVVVLDRGVVQQVDEPMALYQRPVNRFVAGFLGWPAMNFLDGELTAREARLGFAVEASDLWLPLPVAKMTEWQPYKGRPLTLGIRPEDIVADGSGAGLAMKVALREPLGHAWLVTYERQGVRLTARVASGLEIGKGLKLHMERTHLFDRSTGLALGPSRPAG
jgi:multiple sugar transport system ATP-binding protein